jgi:hypothetical protein
MRGSGVNKPNTNRPTGLVYRDSFIEEAEEPELVGRIQELEFSDVPCTG